MTTHHLSQFILFGSVFVYGLIDARAGWAQDTRTFLVGGYMLGFESGWRAGAGIELLPPARRVGRRASVQRRLTGDSPAWLLEIGLATR